MLAMKTINIQDEVSKIIQQSQPSRSGASLTATTLAAHLDLETAPTLEPSQPLPLFGEIPPPVEGNLGRFAFRSEIGKGGMGRVVEARDTELLRSVAIKLLLDPNEVDPVRVQRFVTEAQLTAQLDHPNIVPVHELGVTPDGQLYFVMKKIEGASLRQLFHLLRTGGPEAAQGFNAFRLTMAFVFVCNAVGYAHDRGVLHRDLKPDNIMLGPFGQLLVMDWGIARVVGDTSEATTVETVEDVSTVRTLDGAVIGTPGYMSPEQAQGDLAKLDGRSDIWSLGAILYEGLTLQPPYVGDNVYSLLLQTVQGPPPDPRERAPEQDIDDEIADIVMKSLATDPHDRFDNAVEMAVAIGTYLEHRGETDPDGDRCAEPRSR